MNYRAALLSVIAGQPNDAQLANILSLEQALVEGGRKAGLGRPHRLAQFVPQVGHESGRFLFDREKWGPTPAQKRYEGRVDLGNVIKGDGAKFRGYGPIQVTGRRNVMAFYRWCVGKFGKEIVPDFVANPKMICTDPWEGLSAIWYWDSGNPTGQSLNRYADDGSNEMVTRRINGGLNGYSDRLELYDRVALHLLGWPVGDIKGFQAANGLLADGVSGPKTRAVMHKLLVAKSAQKTVQAEEPAPAPPHQTTAQTPSLPTPAAPSPPKLTLGRVMAAVAALILAAAGYFFKNGG